MKVTETSLPGVLLIEPRVFSDDRGSLAETWNADRYAGTGIPSNMVQDNLSISKQGVLRGLHYQQPHAQGKLVYVLEGSIFDVAVDIRPDSPTFRNWFARELSHERLEQLWIPPGFAHGFCVLSPLAVVAYKCTDKYYAEADAGIRWNDPTIGVKWPLSDPLLSPKDQKSPLLADVPRDRLPTIAAEVK